MRSLIAFFFKMAVKLRHFLYDHKLIFIHTSPIRIISVGSIQMGGVGKTPFCIYLGQILMQLGIVFGFVSRGYKSRAENKLRPTLIDKVDPKYFGDEPTLIHSLFPTIPFAVGKNRFKGVNLLASQGVKLALLDDGFQHRKLQKDLQIVLVDAADPISSNFFFPKGNLRDDPRRLKEADLIVAIGDKNELLKKKLFPYTDAKIIWAKKMYGKIYDQNQHPLRIEGEKIAAFAAIATPEVFFEELKKKCELVLTKTLKDHEEMSQLTLARYIKKAKNLGAKYIVCTQKDIIKLSKNHHFVLPIGYLSMNIEITQGKNIFMSAIRKVCGLEKKQLDGQDKSHYVTV